MADIADKIAILQNAVYGKDVRDAMVDIFTTINNDYTSFLSQYSTLTANLSYLMDQAEVLEGKKLLDIE